MRNKKLVKVMDSTEIANMINANMPAEQPKVLQPAIIFRNNTAPSVQSIIESREDPDYQMRFARSVINDESDGFKTQHTVADTYSDKVLSRILTIGANPAYREVIESNADKTCANSVLSLRRDAMSAALYKFNTAIEQNVNYAISDAIGCIIALLEQHDNTKDAVDLISNEFTVSGNNWGHFYTASYVNYANYLNTIGDVTKTENNNAFDDACILVYNDIVSNIFDSISHATYSVVSMLTKIVYSPNAGIGVNDASNVIVTFNNILTESMAGVSNVIQENAYSLLNDLILISHTLYGNADINSRPDYDYCCEF